MKCHCGSFVIKSYWKTGSYLTKCPKCNSTGMIQDKPYERKSTKASILSAKTPDEEKAVMQDIMKSKVSVTRKKNPNPQV